MVTPKKYTATEYLNDELTYYIKHLHKDEAGYMETTTEGKNYGDKEKYGTTIEYEIDGKTYTFKYESSRDRKQYNHGVIDIYANEKDFGKRVVLEFNNTLNRVTALYSISCEEGYDSTDLTRDEALEKAKEILRAHTSAASEYQVTSENKRSNETYYFRMNRFVGGTETNEYAMISINFDGTVNSYKLVCLGAFDGVDISGVDMNAVKASIKEKADKTYEGYTYEVTGEEISLIRKEDGSFTFNVHIDTKVSGKEFETPINDRMKMFINLE